MLRTLSSGLTFFWKCIFPVLWVFGLGLHALLTFTTGSHWFGPREKWFFLALWPLGSIVCFWFPLMRVKRVRMDGEFLYVSNYLREAKIPLRNVWAVNMWTIRPLSPRKLEERPVKPFVVVEFESETRFGNRIVFIARDEVVSSGQWNHQVVGELRQAVNQALVGPTTPGESAARDLGRAREEALLAKVQLFDRTWGTWPSKPTLRLQVRYVRRYRLLWGLFGFPGLFFLMGLVLAVVGLVATSIDFANSWAVGAGVRAAMLIGFTLFLGAYFVQVVYFWLTAPARLVPYFERPLDAKTWGAFKRTVKVWDFGVSSEPLDAKKWEAFKRGFALARGFDVVERRASQLGVAPLSTFGFGDDMLGQVVVWHAAEGGLKTVRALIASSQQEAVAPELLEDLQVLEAVLQRAEAAVVRFALVMRICLDDWISHAEMYQRKGFFW